MLVSRKGLEELGFVLGESLFLILKITGKISMHGKKVILLLRLRDFLKR